MMSIAIRYHQNEEDALHVLNLAFYKVLTKIETHETSSSFKAWVRTILINTIISEHRKNHNYKNFMAPTDFEAETGSLQDWEYDEINEQLSVDFIRQKMQELDEPQRTIINLYVVEGYNHKEIGEMLEIPVGTSKWHLSNARKTLKKVLSKAIDISKAMML